MPRTQFSLKTMLVWLALLPASVGVLSVGMTSEVRPYGFALISLAGALLGLCVGAWKSWPHAVFGAAFGAVLIWPLLFVAMWVLFWLDVLPINDL